MTIFFIFVLIFLTFASAFFSGSEVALFSLSSIRLKTYKTSKSSKKLLIASLLQNPRDLLVTIFILNTLVNILLQNTASHIFGEKAGWGLKVGVPFFITLILGEIIPKNICMQKNESFALAVVPSINFFHRLLKSVRKLTIAVTYPISRVMFSFLRRETSISKEELVHVLESSERHGVLHSDEASLARGYIKLQDTVVKEIMVAKEDVLAYNLQEPLSKLVHHFVDQECSKIPVYRGMMENVLGVITANNFFLHRKRITSPEMLKPFLFKPFFVPETMPARTLMRQFQELERATALVVNEYGSISGLVAYEDIVELVIGNITDKRDLQPLFTKAGKNVIIASGKLELAEFNRIFNADFSSKMGMVTIGGWLIEQMDEIPKGGSTFECNHFLFQVLGADPNKIRRLYIRRLSHNYSKGR